MDRDVCSYFPYCGLKGKISKGLFLISTNLVAIKSALNVQ